METTSPKFGLAIARPQEPKAVQAILDQAARNGDYIDAYITPERTAVHFAAVADAELFGRYLSLNLEGDPRDTATFRDIAKTFTRRCGIAA